MIAIREISNGEIQFVQSTEGYDESFEILPDPPEGTEPTLLRWTGTDWYEDLEAFEAVLHTRIDTEAGAWRCHYITDVPGQQLTYQRKEEEARAWIAATDPDIADYPFLAAEASATGLDPSGAANEIIAAADLWTILGSLIEGARIGAKRAVTIATTYADKKAAAVVDWEAVCAI